MLIFVSCLVIFVYGLLSSLLGTILPGLPDKLHLSNLELGYIALAQGLGLARAFQARRFRRAVG